MWQSRLPRLVIPNWGSCLRIICNLLSKVISSPGGPKLFIWLFDIVFGSWHSSQFPADRHLQQTVATSVPSIHRSFHRSFVRWLFTRWFVWERLFVLSFIQAFNCQATKCKQISSRSSSNNHKSLQPFSRYWSWNMQHATWKHDRDCRVPQVPQVDACTQNELAFKLPHWLVQWIPFFFYFYLALAPLELFFPHTFNSIKQISDRLIGSIGETTFLFCPKNWQIQKQKHSKKKKRRNCRELWKK